MSLAALACLLFIGVTTATPSNDLVTHIPGLAVQPAFKTYSGYLQATGTRRLHYWFAESQSNPAKDPLVLWFNGGPGCSSMEGMLREHGPFNIQADGVSLKPNPYAWNRVANMLYLEAPAGVGFSYSSNRNYATGDAEVANANYAALKNFFTKFPAFANNTFFITGESYAGVYVPTLAAHVALDPHINFEGIMVGNGLSSYHGNDNSVMYFWYYHGLIGQTTWDRLVKECCGGSEKNCDFIEGAKKSFVCRLDVSEVQQSVYGSGINMYNILAPCAGGVTSPAGYTYQSKDGVTVLHHDFGNLFRENHLMHKHRLALSYARQNETTKVKLAPPCTNDTEIEMYMNSQIVKKALHIPPGLPTWTLCSDAVSAGYHRDYETMDQFYHVLMSNSKKLRLMLYNGDIDMACNFLGDEWFVDGLGKKLLVQRRPWLVKDDLGYEQIAGYVKEFEKLSFVTVKGAGHMVPADKPKEAFEMFRRFTSNLPF